MYQEGDYGGKCGLGKLRTGLFIQLVGLLKCINSSPAFTALMHHLQNEDTMCSRLLMWQQSKGNRR